MKYRINKISFEKIKSVIDKYSNYTFKVFGSRARGDFKKAQTLILL